MSDIQVKNGQQMGDKWATYNDGIAVQSLHASGLCNIQWQGGRPDNVKRVIFVMSKYSTSSQCCQDSHFCQMQMLMMLDPK